MEVWTLVFMNWDFADCNGVFSTKEKALDAFFQHFKRNDNHWSEPVIEEDDGDWMLLNFQYHDDGELVFSEQVVIEKDILDRI